MTSLGFENYAEALKIYLTKYREVSTQLYAHLIHSFLSFPFSFASFLHTRTPPSLYTYRPSPPPFSSLPSQTMGLILSLDPNCKGGKPEPTLQQWLWLRWPSRRSRPRSRRHGRSSSSTTSGLRSPTTPRGCQQPFECESRSERAGWRDIRIPSHGRHGAQWRRWRDLLTLSKTIPGSKRRWEVVRNYNMSTRHLPVPRARQ